MADPPNEEKPTDQTAGFRLTESLRTTNSAAIAGVAYAVLSVATRALFQTLPDSSASDLAAWFSVESNGDSMLLALNLASFATVAFLWFVAVIRRQVGDREDQFFATVFVGSGTVLVIASLIAAAATTSPAIGARLLGSEVSESAADFAASFGTTMSLVVAPRIEAVFVMTTSTVILHSEALPRWLAIVGYGFGGVMFLAPFVSESMSFGFPIWVLLVSIVLLLATPRDLNGDGSSPAQPLKAGSERWPEA